MCAAFADIGRDRLFTKWVAAYRPIQRIVLVGHIFGTAGWRWLLPGYAVGQQKYSGFGSYRGYPGFGDLIHLYRRDGVERGGASGTIGADRFRDDLNLFVDPIWDDVAAK